MKKLILLLLLYFIYSYEENSIIKIPNSKGRFENIPTKYGLINYEFIYESLPTFRWPLPFIQYNLEGINNLSLFQLPEDKLYEQYKVYGEKNNSIQIFSQWRENDIFNPLICEIFYKTKYIDKMIYSIGYYENYRPYKFFGGTPNKIIKNLQKFTFNNNTDIISKIEIKFDNGKNFTINIEEKNKRFQFDEEYGNMIGLPYNIFNIFYNKIFKDYKEEEIFGGFYVRYHVYKLNEEQIKAFPNITFTIGNKILNLNRKNAISTKNNYLFIHKYSYYYNEDEFHFGQKFFELFNITEFDLHSGDTNLYLEKNKDYIIEKEDNKKNIKNSDFDIIVIIFFMILISMIITVFKNYYKNKKIEYYNQYYEI